MFIDTIVYVAALLTCIAVGSSYKKIENVSAKKIFGTGLGMIVVFLICRLNALHSLLMTIGNIMVIKCCNRRYEHQLSLAYSWVYLFYLHFNSSMSAYAMGVHQMLALRLVGLASELNTSDFLKQHAARGGASKFLSEVDIITSEPTVIDMFHYTYNFIGILKGPYYRWQMFNDYFSLPFASLGDCSEITIRKFKKIPIYIILYVWLRLKFPPKAYASADFYWRKGSDYRYLYNIPQLAQFVLSSQIVSLLCSSVCSEAGFVIYPDKCKPQPGMGPSQNVELIRLASNNSDVALRQKYNFSTIKTFDNWLMLKGPSMRKTLKNWNMPLQYWFWAHIYRKINHRNKVVKNTMSFAVWSMWCGPTVNHLILGTTLWIYMNLEDYFTDFFKKSSIGAERREIQIGFSVMRVLCLVYITPCLILSQGSLVEYYCSIYWEFHIVMVLFIVLAYFVDRISR